MCRTSFVLDNYKPKEAKRLGQGLGQGLGKDF